MKADRGDDKSHVLGILPAENDDAADKLSAAVLIHQRDQTVSKLHFNGLDGQEGIHIVDVFEIVGFAGGLDFGGSR